MFQWIYKKIQYKMFLKKSNAKKDSLRFRLETILKDSSLEDFVDKETYIEYKIENKTIAIISNKKLTIKYNSLTEGEFYINKILFLNDNRSSIAEILSSPSGLRAKFSLYTNDMINNFKKSLDNLNQNTQIIQTMDINVQKKKKVGYEQYYIQRENKGNKEIKLENASSGEKSSVIIELICSYFASEYDFYKAFSNGIREFLWELDINKLENVRDYLSQMQNNQNMCILIEEPENNLYPTNQEKISYYLADLRTKKHKPQVIISTHSPYILSALNNTLYAGQLLNKKIEIEKIEKILPSSLKPSEFIAYKIENGMATNIIDTETNLINAEEIDGASDSIMDKFDMLLELNHTPKVNK
ncbi:ATP-binding protein [Helicobacter sp. 11154-15]|uniref:ATP-binding protein n=1 Tax=Helicobacter colisuis TaxID=2949739 RepID=A0ABT0TWF3_9HELI|nr:ATP-binding protein [Helicobacter colisuis]